MFELRSYQEEIAEQGLAILSKYKIVYLAMEVRCGKTLTALKTADLYGAKKVLFITKKRAIDSRTILNDYEALSPGFEMQLINKESLHKITDNDFDLVISDEHHATASAYPKANKSAKDLKQRFGQLPMIFLSGTPAAESGSQWYNQFAVSNFSPFKAYKNFYLWAKDYTEPAIKFFGSVQVKDYSKAKTDLIMDVIKPYLLTYTQKEAGFTSEISEHIIINKMTDYTNIMIKNLLKDKVIIGKSDSILADNAAKLMSKVHQISNGTCILESGKSVILDKSKAEFIKNKFRNDKIAIFYYFQKELDLLFDVFGETLTTDINEFNSTNKNFAIQQISGSEAISLKKADYLVFYNFGYSGKNYIQGVARMQTIDRLEQNVYFVFQENDINSKIYKCIKNKKRFNEKYFVKEFDVSF